jgi:ArsR family transcriptional regulator
MKNIFEKLEDSAEKLKVIAHPVRIMILKIFHEEGEMTVTDIQKKLEIDQAVVSHHLSVMRNKNIVACRKAGKNRIYYLKEKRFINILKCVEDN